MQFQHQANRSDGGGILKITAETPEEILELYNHSHSYNKGTAENILQLADWIKAGRAETTFAGTDRRPWFNVSVHVGSEFLKPYLNLLERLTGYSGSIPTTDLTKFHPRRLCYTHHTMNCILLGGTKEYVAEVCLTAEDWNGRDAATNAERNAIDYVQEELGYRFHEKEFIEKSGRYVNNPNYLKRHAPKPGIGAPWLWKVLFSWWRENYTTPQQQNALDSSDRSMEVCKLDKCWEVRQGGGNEATLVDSQGIYLSIQEPLSRITWEDFKKLGK